MEDRQLLIEHCSSHRSIASYSSRTRDLCLPHLHSTPSLEGYPSEYCHNVLYGNTRIVWLRDGGKKSENTITHFGRIHERDRRTDGRTDGRTDTALVHSIARQKWQNIRQDFKAYSKRPSFACIHCSLGFSMYRWNAIIRST